MKNLLFLVSFIFLSLVVVGQDTLYKRNHEVLVVKISEVGLDEVKYKLWGYESGPVVVIAKDQLLKIVFANGMTQYTTPEMTNPENYASQKRNAVKIDFVSPLRNNLSFIYERSIRPGRSFEFNIGIIGVGIGTRDFDKSSGAFFRAGYKFFKSPDFYLRGMRYSHVLKGGYIRPDFILGSYEYQSTIDNSYQNPLPPYNYIYSKEIVSRTTTFGSLQLSFGKQWVYDDALLFDVFAGMGYTVTSTTGTVNESEPVLFGVTGGGETPFSVSGGIRIGFLFK